jgi:hypothetical protein
MIKPSSPIVQYSSIRHLTYHIWPTIEHDAWKWNLQQLAARWSLFNGTKILAIVTDGQSVEANVVLEFARSLGMHFDHVIQMRNHMLREVVTWLPMLEILSPETAAENEVVFSAHGKGVRHSATGNQVTDWADLMYRSCLDDWPTVEAQLAQFVATGSFKRYNNFDTPGNHCWHYSGTFFWWRLAEIGRRNWRKVDAKYFGTESWIGHQAPPEECGCLFLDGSGDLYSREYWTEVVWPAWTKYQEQS